MDTPDNDDEFKLCWIHKVAMTKKERLSQLPQVDECLKGIQGQAWLASFPRRDVVRAIREVIARARKAILEGAEIDVSVDALARDIELMEANY